MSSAPVDLRQLIWATRGRTWGFRFLLDGGLADPLLAYEAAFRDLTGSVVWRLHGDTAALRFPDPLGRRDTAGRVIPHEFVLQGAQLEDIDSQEEATARVWPLVSRSYAAVWDTDSAPGSIDLDTEG